ncbi:TfoX/Sxy family protein [uncultured Aquimarina sp.]|uniref:TfoX/Sxy family protein n=1 Tax=uncultured Aquimarina sp. TaxID=575652 RepID=UPI00261BEF2A|nr:TfoX/Sxy family protein [uncultured Aquimarina sp.]
MASDQNFVDFVVGQIKNTGEINAKKMFGEYGVYADGKMFGLVCDNKLFIKPTTSGRDFIGNIVEAPPYPGAKPSFLIEEKIEDSDWLSELVSITVKELPEPKPKRKKKKRT